MGTGGSICFIGLVSLAWIYYRDSGYLSLMIALGEHMHKFYTLFIGVWEREAILMSEQVAYDLSMTGFKFPRQPFDLTLIQREPEQNK